MLKSIIFKEWLKVRWFLIILTALGVMAVGNIFLEVQHYMTFQDANKYWFMFLFQNNQYFSYLKFVPLFIGLAVAVAQYTPEIMRKRIKLTFHLPVVENKMLLSMIGFGFVSILISYMVIFSMFYGLSNHYFPNEIVNAAIISIAPWFLAGIAAYFLASLIIMEAIWKYRIAYFIVACAFVLLYFNYSIIGGYAPVNLKLSILTLLMSVSLLFSAYRFRKGEM